MLHLVCDYLRKSGHQKAFAALVEEASLEEISSLKPSLTEIVDEWSELLSMFDSAQKNDLEYEPDVAGEVGNSCASVAEDVVSKVSSTSAALCCAFDGTNLVWGEANRTIHFRDSDVVLADSTCGGVLSVAVTKGVVVVGTMSGLVFVSRNNVDFVLLSPSHSKYAHRVCVNDKFVVSASHDHTVCIWDLQTEKLQKQLKLSATCEGLCFVGESKLLVSVRESNLLRLVDLDALCEDTELVLLNLNVFGDNHVSFSVLDVAVFKHLLAVVSDRDRVFVYWLAESSCRLVATLTGLSTDSLSSARCAFSPCGTLL
jgi:WD40 repeat protein